jgi:17beta-estradiol 17-dehydrogenase / very-long-chain 3-oxoacyl-CoA reductase
VITGASDGIGKEFALQLASEGFNVVLVSRTRSKLEALAKEIESKYVGIRSRTLAMDFARNNNEDYNRLMALVDGLDVAILINNVGKSHDIPVPFVLTSTQEMSDIIAINCVGTLRVTQIIAPGMAVRRRGLILTMGSFGGLLPTPLLATYSGSKAFLQQWSSALGSELKPHGVQVELVLSYLVTSSMSKIRRPNMFIPSPKDFVRAVLGRIGRSGGAQGTAHTSTPYWSHGIMHWALATFVGLSNSFVVDRNKVMHESIRRRALRKQEREGKKSL